MTFTEFAHKKVLGVPVIYVAGAAVAILAVVAWKLKPATPAADAGDTTGGTAADNAIDPTDYSGLASNGSVTVVQASTDTTADPVVKTNSDWVREGAEWLTTSKGVPGSQAAAALNKYINGVDRSFDEQTLVDQVIAEKGQPPDDIAEGGNVGAKPAKKQFPEPPGVHTITGDSDNGYPQLATLYYGSSSADRQDLIQAANTNLGLAGPWSVGTKVTIPKFQTILIYKTTKPIGKSALAGQLALSRAQLDALNNGPTWTAWGSTVPAGKSVRYVHA